MTNNEVLALPHGHVIKSYFWPWLVRLSGLSAGLQNERLLVRFPVRAQAWVAGHVLTGGARERQPHIDVSLPLCPFPLSKNKKIKSFFKKVFLVVTLKMGKARNLKFSRER